MLNNTAKIIVVSAPSGAGKTSILKHILSTYKNIIFSVSATTRPKRDYEVDGVDYFFLSKEEFEEKIRNNEFIEYEKFYDNYYGTLKKFVDDNLGKGLSVILEIDVNGASNIKKIYPDAVTIFIAPPNIETLIERLKSRNTEDEESLRKRIERFEYELSFADKYDYKIVNDKLDVAIKDFENILKKENII
jgi:guanylate kinase